MKILELSLNIRVQNHSMSSAYCNLETDYIIRETLIVMFSNKEILNAAIGVHISEEFYSVSRTYLHAFVYNDVGNCNKHSKYTTYSYLSIKHPYSIKRPVWPISEHSY